jgi:hypothetical protein
METTIGTLAKQLDITAREMLDEVIERGVNMFRHNGQLITAGYVHTWINLPWHLDPLPELQFEATPEVEARIAEQGVATISVPVAAEAVTERASK